MPGPCPTARRGSAGVAGQVAPAGQPLLPRLEPALPPAYAASGARPCSRKCERAARPHEPAYLAQGGERIGDRAEREGGRARGRTTRPAAATDCPSRPTRSTGTAAPRRAASRTARHPGRRAPRRRPTRPRAAGAPRLRPPPNPSSSTRPVRPAQAARATHRSPTAQGHVVHPGHDALGPPGHVRTVARRHLGTDPAAGS